jgi:lysophospholipase L1-like esterase
VPITLHLPLTALSCLALCVLVGGCSGSSGNTPKTTEDLPSTVRPAARPDPSWTERHAAILADARAGGKRVAWLGDSITQGWGAPGSADIWKREFAPPPLSSLNAGISGDRTQHVLFRLDDGLLDALKPPTNDIRCVVVLTGTNNTNGMDNTPEEIFAGVREIVGRVRAALPKATIVLHAIFPRGQWPSFQRDKITATNALLVTLADGDTVRWLDVGPRFLDQAGLVRADLMPDYLHLSPAGYEVWADAAKPEIEGAVGR